MFTDWTNTDPHYFYARGFLCGCIATYLFIKAIQSYKDK